MAYDFKKEYKDLYLPKQKPMFIDVPAMTFVAVAGAGNPNKEGGAYQRNGFTLRVFIRRENVQDG